MWSSGGRLWAVGAHQQLPSWVSFSPVWGSVSPLPSSLLVIDGLITAGLSSPLNSQTGLGFVSGQTLEWNNRSGWHCLCVCVKHTYKHVVVLGPARQQREDTRHSGYADLCYLFIFTLVSSHSSVASCFWELLDVCASRSLLFSLLSAVCLSGQALCLAKAFMQWLGCSLYKSVVVYMCVLVHSR